MFQGALWPEKPVTWPAAIMIKRGDKFIEIGRNATWTRGPQSQLNMSRALERWLDTFMCGQYAETFDAYGYKTLQSVSTSWQSQQWLIWMSTWLVKFSWDFIVIRLILCPCIIPVMPARLPEASGHGCDAWTLWENHGKRFSAATILYGWVRASHVSGFNASFEFYCQYWLCLPAESYQN